MSGETPRLRRRHQETAQRGSVTVELVLLTPLLILVLLFVVALGRLAEARLQVNTAAGQAARATRRWPATPPPPRRPRRPPQPQP